LLALASHQLRTPASGVKQYLGLLNSGMLGELSSEQKSVTQKAYDANERQLEIINEMLYVSKADAGQLVIEPKTFNLTALTQTVIDGFAEQASQKDIRIAFRTKRDYQVTADDRYVTMAVENLISNAIKYSYPSSTVRVGIASRGKMVSLYVKDRGVGIAKHNIEMVFGKFNRVDNPLSHSEGGSGLGLFLARQLARAHGGDVTVESALEKGSTFSMTLPKKLTVNQTILHLNRITKIEDE
jgi:signal transduction histidine kinase